MNTSFGTYYLRESFPHSLIDKEPACNSDTRVRSLDLEDPLEKEMATHSSKYSCLENPMDKWTWQATVHGVIRVGHDLLIKPPQPIYVNLDKLTTFF